MPTSSLKVRLPVALSYCDVSDVFAVPGFQYAELLRQVVVRARRENMIPDTPAAPASNPVSQYMGDLNVPVPASEVASSMNGDPNLNFAAGAQAPIGQQDMGLGFDFSLAEHLLGIEAGPVLPHQLYVGLSGERELPVNASARLKVPWQGSHDATTSAEGLAPMDQSYNLDTWFPFPPLGQ